MVIGAMAGQITLLGYMSLRGGNDQQWPFIIPLPFMVLYLSTRCVRVFLVLFHCWLSSGSIVSCSR